MMSGLHDDRGWVIANEPYLEIIYIPGEDNIVVDVLSRPSEGICGVAVEPIENDGEGKNDIARIKKRYSFGNK